jgi:hypothetical protein
MIMLRRDFCKRLPALATLPLLLPSAVSAAHVKITDVRLIKIRLVKDMGIVPRRVGATGGGLPITIGGFTMTEVHTETSALTATDAELIEIRPGRLEFPRAVPRIRT